MLVASSSCRRLLASKMLHLLLLLSITSPTAAMTYRLTIFAPGTVIDGANIQASANGFYLGLSDPSTYCPIGQGCPAIQGTLVDDGMTAMAVSPEGGQSSLGLTMAQVEVPGGQNIYIAPNGQVKYTQAHSAYMPRGSLIGGWFNKTVMADCAPTTDVLDFWAADGSNRGGILLCPNTQTFMKGTGASYQLYAKTTSFNATNCVGAMGLLQHGSAAVFGAWQYT